MKRRTFLQLAGFGTAGTLLPHGSAAAAAGKDYPFELGMASYTFRRFKMEEAVAMTKRLGLRKIAFKDMHLPLDSTPDVIQATVNKVKAEGLDLYGCGVVYMRTAAEVEQAFAYAKAAGMKIIIGVPNHDLLPLAEKKVKETGLTLAIHNHGPGDKLYPTPDSVMEKIKDLDRRIGLCLDVGHTVRLNLDPALFAEKYAARLYDVHIKDMSEKTPKGSAIEMGRGVFDAPSFMRSLVKIKYSGAVSLEYEKDQNDPLAGAAESIGYLRAVLAIM